MKNIFLRTLTDTVQETTDINEITGTPRIIVLLITMETQGITEIPRVPGHQGNPAIARAPSKILASFPIMRNMNGAVASTTPTQPSLKALP